MRRLQTAAFALMLTACGDPAPGQAQTPAGSDPDATAGVETRPANAAGQSPAFAGQTRAPAVKSKTAYAVETVVGGLEKPWAIAFLPDGGMLITERPGRLRLFKDGRLSAPIAGLPEVDARNQGGLLGLALDPAFAQNGLVYFSYAEGRGGGLTNTAVGRGRLVTTAGQPPRLDGVATIFRQTPSLASALHYGGRLVFARDGTLFVTLGERSILEGRRQAQRLDGALGKIVRINADGSIPRDNPFVGRAGVRPEIFSIGHRNVQAAALEPATGALWEVEHGAKGGDELNRVEAGKDYGWPTITYGEEYSGLKIGEGITQRAGMEQPVYYWDPVIAPSGMTFYEGGLFPEWRGNLFVGALGGQHIARLVLDGGRVVGEERLLEGGGERIRDVITGPDGAIYAATDESPGRILRIVPKP